jgi:hypothetical protein
VAASPEGLISLQLLLRLSFRVLTRTMLHMLLLFEARSTGLYSVREESRSVDFVTDLHVASQPEYRKKMVF